MQFTSTQITGKGRGKRMGVPTINLAVPEKFDVQDGVYASFVFINEVKYKGALHIGPVPTFEQKERTIEVYVLDADTENFPETHNIPITVDIQKRIRDILKFDDPQKLVDRIVQDVQEINTVLSRHCER